jgi:hypothetical protein
MESIIDRLGLREPVVAEREGGETAVVLPQREDEE